MFFPFLFLSKSCNSYMCFHINPILPSKPLERLIKIDEWHIAPVPWAHMEMNSGPARSKYK